MPRVHRRFTRNENSSWRNGRVCDVSHKKFAKEGWSPLTYPCPACGQLIVGTDTESKRTPAGYVAYFEGRWMHRDCAVERFVNR